MNAQTIQERYVQKVIEERDGLIAQNKALAKALEACLRRFEDFANSGDVSQAVYDADWPVVKQARAALALCEPPVPALAQPAALDTAPAEEVHP